MTTGRQYHVGSANLASISRETFGLALWILLLGTMPLSISCNSATHNDIPSISSSATQGSELSSEERKSWFKRTATDSEVLSITDDPAFDTVVQQDPYVQCGYNPVTDTDKNIVNQSFSSTDTKFIGSNWSYDGHSDLSIGINGTSAIFNTMYVVSNRQAAPTEVQSFFSTYSNTVSFTNVTNDETQNALGHQGSPPSCGIMLTKALKLTARDKGVYINVTFDKPTPYLISPTLTKARMNYELKNPITVTGITASIDSNNADFLKNGRMRTGTVTLSQIQPNKSFTDSSGNNIVIHGDYAVRIVTEFDGTSIAPLTWLNSINEFFISATTNSIISTVTLIPRTSLSTVIYKAK